MVWYGNKYRGIVVGQDLLMKFSGVGCNLAVWHNIINTKSVYGRNIPQPYFIYGYMMLVWSGSLYSGKMVRQDVKSKDDMV